jgi:hypothetical protein
MLVLIKEDGTGRVDSNSYSSAPDGDAYHDGHLYAADWTAAITGKKEAALVMATRLIDSSYTFNGYRANDTQALQWPRVWARDRDRLSAPFPALLRATGEYFQSNIIPKLLHDATIETARELIKADRTADPDGEGLRQFTLTGVIQMSFDPKDRRPQIPHLALAMLSKLGSLISETSGTIRLTRV